MSNPRRDRSGSKQGNFLSVIDEKRSPTPTGDRPRSGRRRSIYGAASIAASIAGQDPKKRGIVIWPEWSDADINSEKWDVSHKGGKNADKSKSPVVQHFFDDPEGKIEMPQSLKIDSWKRPIDFITEKTPVIVDPDGMNGFDLLTNNEVVHESELMRWITGQIIALWKQSEIKGKDGNPTPVPDPNNPEGEYTHSWRPWEHIYALNKPGKGPNMPAYNPHGKYVVKLYWMGCWRKIVIDDTVPFDENDKMLLPATTMQHELWPMLLIKGLIKIASLDYNGGSQACEFGDFSVINCLTGWLPEAIPLQQGHAREIWELLKGALPEFKLPEPKPEVPEGEQPEGEQPAVDGQPGEPVKEKSSVEKSEKSGDKKDKKEEGKKDAKGDKKDKKGDKDKDKDKAKEKSMLQEEQPLPEHPEVMIFASYSGPLKYPCRVSMLGEMADASERLRQCGLSHMYPHPVLLSQTRSCPLEPPPPPEKIPAWKLIRPKKKKQTPSSEDVEVEEKEEKPIQCVEIVSPFINYKVSPVPIPTDVNRPKSSLTRGQSRISSRPGTANVDPIEETDESVPDKEPEAPQVLKVEEPEPEVKMEEKPEVSSGKGKKKGGSGRPKDGDVSPKLDKKNLTPKNSGVKRVGSATGSKGSSADPKTKASQEAVKAVPSETSDPTGEAVPGEEGEVPLDECPLEEPVKEEVQTPEEDLWMDFEEFTRCFKTLYIYHKTNTYPCNYKNSDLKNVVPSGGKEKRSAPNTAPGGATDDKSPYYLFVDNLKPTEITVSFSSLSRWPEPPTPPPKEESKTNVKGKDKGGDRDSKAEQLTAESSSIIEAQAQEPRPPEPIQPGLLVAEPHSWKSVVNGQPILRLRSTATRAAVLSLPAGRHVLRFNMQAPLGYHIHLCSATQFVFGDEEKVMAELTKESCRFVDNATQVIQLLGKCINVFNDQDMFKQAWDEFYACHCPYRNDKHASKQYHFRVFNDAFYNMLRKVLVEASLTNGDMAYAWKTFMYDATTKNPLSLAYGSSSRPATGVTQSDRGSATKQKGKQTKRETLDSKLDHWKNRDPTADEMVAAVRIQKMWRGTWVRKIRQGRTPGTDENMKAHELLQKAWNAIEPNAEQNGLYLFRTMFKSDPDLMEKYPFYKDEWNKISYNDYQGTHTDQPPNTWFIVFREVFFVQEPMLCVPKLYVPVPTCMLRVINNDTGEEIPRIFQKVAPYVYKKNRRGYTFVAEARTTELGLQAGRWRMRLIGSLSPLPAPAKNEVNGTFHTRELRDYYLPNEKNIILRYSVKVNEEHTTSLQLQTSKPDVYVKLMVLDNESEVISAVGKGHVVLPACILHKDFDPAEDTKRSNSRTSNKGGKSNTKAGRRSSVHGEGRVSRSSSRRSLCSTDDEDEKETKPHKYIIQAEVLRNSWPLSESQWQFVQVLKDLEKNELKVSHKERPPSAAQKEKPTAAATSKSKGKDKGKGSKDKDKTSRPPSQQFDFTKPNWTLRFVSDGSAAEDVEVKKDTERADEIRAMKKAWEDAEPGRAAKAMQSRLKYLNQNVIKLSDEEEKKEEVPAEGDQPASLQTAPADGATSPQPSAIDPLESETNLTLEPPPPPQPKERINPVDKTPFIRNTGGTPRLRDDMEIQRQLETKQQEIAAYRAFREEVERQREEDRQRRNQEKIKQLELFEDMQAELDLAREEINKPREAYRQKFLEAERKRLEEIAAQEAALLAEQQKNAPSPKGRKSAKGKKSANGKKKK